MQHTVDPCKQSRAVVGLGFSLVEFDCHLREIPLLSVLRLHRVPGRERALVLGGGGAAGNAWEIGVIAGAVACSAGKRWRCLASPSQRFENPLVGAG
jgi:hypothetical protein